MAKTISYNRLWKMLIDKNMNRQDLKKATGISSTCVAKMGKGENVTTEVLLRICRAMKCDVGDIMEFVSDEAEEVENTNNIGEKSNIIVGTGKESR